MQLNSRTDHRRQWIDSHDVGLAGAVCERVRIPQIVVRCVVFFRVLCFISGKKIVVAVVVVGLTYVNVSSFPHWLSQPAIISLSTKVQIL